MRFGILGLVLGLAGCAASSPRVTHVAAAPAVPKVTADAVASFKPEVATVDQVLQALGPPMGDIVTPEGDRRLAYSYVPVTPHWIAYLPILSAFSSDSPPNGVVLRFHRDGTLADITPTQ